MLEKPWIFVLILNQSKVYHSLKRNYLVHMINTDLKILVLTQRINYNLHIVLVLVKRDKFLKFFGCLLRKISLQYIWKTIRQLKFTCDNFS